MISAFHILFLLKSTGIIFTTSWGELQALGLSSRSRFFDRLDSSRYRRYCVWLSCCLTPYGASIYGLSITNRCPSRGALAGGLRKKHKDQEVPMAECFSK